MKRLVSRITVVLSLSLSLIPTALLAEEVELKLASWGPAKHYIAEARAEWVKEVNEAAKGQLKIVEYPGGQLFGPKEMHAAVAKGTIDIGVVLQPRAMAMVPMLQGVYLPFAYDTVEGAAQAYQGESREIIERAMEKKRMKLIYASFAGGVNVFSSKGSLDSADDFKGLRVLATSPMVTEIMNRLGASPDTSIPQTEQYMAVKRGVADASLNTVVSGFFQKTFEVSPFMTTIDMSFPTVLIAMNLKQWNKLPEDVQKIMLDIGKSKEAKTLAYSKGWDTKFTGELAKAGATVTSIPEAERENIKLLSKGVWEDWAKANGDDAIRLLELNLAN